MASPRLPGVGRALALVAAVASCAPQDGAEAPRFPFAGAWRGTKAGTPVLLSDVAWWEGLRDPVLDQLVSRALTESLTLEIARERIDKADAELRAIPSPVQSSGELAVAGEGGTGSGGLTGTADAAAGVSWLWDIWGEKQAQYRSGRANLVRAAAERDAAQLLMLTNLCQAYLQLRFRQELLSQRRAELDRRTQTLSITEKLLSADAATTIDIKRSQARVAQVEAELPVLIGQIEASKNEIAALVGVVPGSLGIDLGPRGQPRARMSPDMGIPSDLVRNRPDIRVAEQSYYVALADVDVVQAAQYPTLSLSGTISLRDVRGGTSATQYALGPTLSIPQPNEALVDIEESSVREAYTDWKLTVIRAITDVESALVEYNGVTSSLGAAERSYKLYSEARELTFQVYEAGGATLSNVIDADDEMMQADEQLAGARYSQALGFVLLNVALGAGNSVGLPAPPEASAAPPAKPAAVSQ